MYVWCIKNNGLSFIYMNTSKDKIILFKYSIKCVSQKGHITKVQKIFKAKKRVLYKKVCMGMKKINDLRFLALEEDLNFH